MFFWCLRMHKWRIRHYSIGILNRMSLLISLDPEPDLNPYFFLSNLYGSCLGGGGRGHILEPKLQKSALHLSWRLVDHLSVWGCRPTRTTSTPGWVRSSSAMPRRSWSRLWTWRPQVSSDDGQLFIGWSSQLCGLKRYTAAVSRSCFSKLVNGACDSCWREGG